LNFNPYQPPTSAYDGSYTNYGQQGGAVPERTVTALRKTRPWLVFIAVVTFVFSGLVILGGVALLTEEDMEGLILIVSAGLALLPGIAMIRYASAINRLLHGGGVPELDRSMEAQASVWTIAGVYMLIYVALLSVIFFVAVIEGI
jgi:hypothetical protein